MTSKRTISKHNILGVRILGPFLKDLIPVLINGMKYSENDIMALKGDEVSLIIFFYLNRYFIVF